MTKSAAMNDRIMMGVPPVPNFCSFDTSGMIAKVTQNCKLLRKDLSMKITRIETRIHRSAFTYGVGLDAQGGNFNATGGNLRLKSIIIVSGGF
jgi:hypothetical protein